MTQCNLKGNTGRFGLIESVFLIFILTGCGNKITPSELISTNNKINVEKVEFTELIKFDNNLREVLIKNDEVYYESPKKQKPEDASKVDELWRVNKFEELLSLCQERSIASCEYILPNIINRLMIGAKDLPSFVKFEDQLQSYFNNQKFETKLALDIKAGYYGRSVRNKKYRIDDDRGASDAISALQNSFKLISAGYTDNCNIPLEILQNIQAEKAPDIFRKNANLIIKSCKDNTRGLSEDDYLTFDVEMFYWGKVVAGESNDLAKKNAEQYRVSEQKKLDEIRLSKLIRSKFKSAKFSLLLYCDYLYGNGWGLVKSALSVQASNPSSFPYMMTSGGSYMQYCKVTFSPVTNLELLKDAEIAFTQDGKEYIYTSFNGQILGIIGQ